MTNSELAWVDSAHDEGFRPMWGDELYQLKAEYEELAETLRALLNYSFWPELVTDEGLEFASEPERHASELLLRLGY